MLPTLLAEHRLEPAELQPWGGPFESQRRHIGVRLHEAVPPGGVAYEFHEHRGGDDFSCRILYRLPESGTYWFCFR